MIPIEATKEYAQGRFGVWPEDADADGALRETARALDNVVNIWIDVRTHYRRTMLDLTQTPFGAAKAAAKHRWFNSAPGHHATHSSNET